MMAEEYVGGMLTSMPLDCFRSNLTAGTLELFILMDVQGKIKVA
jgi:hypothetical protein